MMQLRLPNWLLTTALAATAALTPLSSANAQDIKAVERRLGGAVESGEITLDQAKTMLDALRKSAAKSKGYTATNIRAYYRDVQQKLAAAVKAGQISEKDAKIKLEAIRKDLTAKARTGKAKKPTAQAKKAKPQTKKAQPQAENVGRRLRAAVQRGDMTATEARKKFAEVMQKQTDRPITAKAKAAAKKKQDQRALRQRYAGLQKRVETAVKAGRISREDGEKRLIAARKEMFGAAKSTAKKTDQKKLDQRAVRQRYADLQKRIEAAVKAGKISREDGKKRLGAARARIQAARNASSKAAKKAPKKAAKKKINQRSQRLRYAEIEKRLKEAVKAGKVSRKDADKELIEIRKEMFGNRKPDVRRRDETDAR